MSPVEGAAAVILAGGAGTRLWPLSRSATPKHLLRLVGDRTLLRSTYERARLVADRVLVVTEASQLEACRRELPELADEDWIAEPGRRGTAACLALAAASLPADGLMLSLHADHLIPDSAAFASTARAALRLAARSGSLGTIGVRPTGPSTGFGYIHLGEPVEGAPAGDGDGAPAGDVAVPSAEGREAAAPPRAFRALGFVEKPPLAAAERMVAGGDHLWNTGIFAWRNATFLAELAQHAPAIHAGAGAAAAARQAGDDDSYRRLYLDTPEMAVDHAVMERTGDLLVTEATFGWSDVGSWADLAEVLAGDAAGNVILGGGPRGGGASGAGGPSPGAGSGPGADSGSSPALVLDGSHNLVRTGGRLVAVVGLDDVVVIDTKDALLVLPRDRAQDVKRVVEELRRRGRTDLL